MRLEMAAASSGAIAARIEPARRPRGATSISPRSSLDRAHDRVGHVLRRAGADPSRQAHSRFGEHAGVADEAREHRRDADAAAVQLQRACRRRNPAARTWRRCRATCAVAAALPESEQMKSSWPLPRASMPGIERVGERDRRAQVDLERTIDLAGCERLEPPEAGSAALAIRMSTGPARDSSRSTSARSLRSAASGRAFSRPRARRAILAAGR